MRKITQLEYEENVYNKVKDEYGVVGIYKNTRTKIEMKHNKCGNIYPVTPHDFLSGRRCPKCNPKKNKNTKKFIEEVKNLVGDEYSILGKYINSKMDIQIKHNKCKYIYDATPNEFLSGNRCPQCEKLRRKQYNRNNQKYEINERYFSEWSNDMAYIIGLISADGCMSQERYRLRIDSIDKELLKSIAEKINYTRPISIRSNKKGTWYELCIDNKVIHEDLERIGIKPKKTFTINIPNIPSKYKYDFFRGYFDGDGCVYRKKNKDCNIPGIAVDIATASKDMKDILVNIIEEMVDYKFGVSVKERNNGLFIIRANTKVSKIMYEKMYYEGCLHLDRKREKFEEIELERSLKYKN